MINLLKEIKKRIFQGSDSHEKKLARFNNRFIVTAVFFATALAFPMYSQAQTVNMTLTGVGNGTISNGVYVSPYNATINGVSALVICDDYLTDVGIGQSWSASVTNLSTLQSQVAANTMLKFDITNAAQQKLDYNTAAYLAVGIMNSYYSGNTASQINYSFALWKLFDPSLSITSQQQTLLAQAETSAIGGSPKGYSINLYTPHPLNASQEYITVTPVPEPGTYALLGTFILLLPVARRLRRSAAPASKG